MFSGKIERDDISGVEIYRTPCYFVGDRRRFSAWRQVYLSKEYALYFQDLFNSILVFDVINGGAKQVFIFAKQICILKCDIFRTFRPRWPSSLRQQLGTVTNYAQSVDADLTDYETLAVITMKLIGNNQEACFTKLRLGLANSTYDIDKPPLVLPPFGVWSFCDRELFAYDAASIWPKTHYEVSSSGANLTERGAYFRPSNAAFEANRHFFDGKFWFLRSSNDAQSLSHLNAIWTMSADANSMYENELGALPRALLTLQEWANAAIAAEHDEVFEKHAHAMMIKITIAICARLGALAYRPRLRSLRRSFVQADHRPRLVVEPPASGFYAF